MKNLQINCPEGYMIDHIKSNLNEGIIYFEEIKKSLDYNSISKDLFYGKQTLYIDDKGNIHYFTPSNQWSNSNNSTTKEQLEAILALNKLCNVAKYLNGDWVSVWNSNIRHYCIQYNTVEKKLSISCYQIDNIGAIFFKSKELALEAIQILGEATVIQALNLNH
jgi:hypothetical protein